MVSISTVPPGRNNPVELSQDLAHSSSPW